jgi:hypothetical protein
MEKRGQGTGLKAYGESSIIGSIGSIGLIGWIC